MKVTYILFFVFPKSKTFHCNNIQTSTHLCFFPDAKQKSYKNNTTDSIRDWGLNPTIRPRSTALFFSPIWKVQLDDSERSSLLALSWPTEFFDNNFEREIEMRCLYVLHCTYVFWYVLYVYTHTRVFEYSPAVVSHRGGGYVFVEAFILSMLKYTSVYLRDTVYISKEVSINRLNLGCPRCQSPPGLLDFQ